MGNSNSKFSGKVAVVTGASKGIGAEIARQLAASGASVVVNYSASGKEAEKVVADIESAGGRAAAVQANLSKPAEVSKLFEETKKRFGKLDILVNNAGVYDFKPLEEVTPEHFHKQFDLNVLGLLLATQEAVKQFGNSGGAVVNIGSVVGKAAVPNSAVYSATKAAVDSITRVLAAELGPRGIRVNAVNPGMVETEGAVEFTKGDFRKKIESETPLGRIGQVGDIAPVALYLASEDARWITGETLYVSGGNR
jgi:3-oxoacyl-[acyl-carrier protein] reductase